MTSIELPLFVHWEKTLKDVLSRTQKFPKRVRFTFSSRIDNLALDILEKIVEARYTRDKTVTLVQASLLLEKLRVLFRISHEEKYLDHKGFEQVARNIDEAGKMLGGWIRSRSIR
ncbi:MAG: diversity-generating retroelement protein Avd [Elusimicrobia bacterium]|nr:diversity-generating retroelement protein Avd [Elusimicrobiota bacterium]